MKPKTSDLLNELEAQNYEMLNEVNKLEGEGKNKIILAVNPTTKNHWIKELFKRYQQLTPFNDNEQLKIMNKMKTVKVIFADPKYNYKTDCSPLASDESIRKYFVGKFFDVGTYNDYKQAEDVQKCINIEIL